MDRDETCMRCKIAWGTWECANCHEVPLCDACVAEYKRTGWEGHGCFCETPRHIVCPIATVFPDDFDDDLYYGQP